MTHPPMTPDERYATLVDALLGRADVTLGSTGKTGFGSAALRVHGKIFAMLVTDTLVVKLSRRRVDALIAGGAGERFAPRHDGRLMKEWIAVSPTPGEEWLPLAREALAFVSRDDD